MNRVKQIREQLQLTQEQMAALCGTTSRTIRRWETPPRAPAKCIWLVEGALRCKGYKF